MDNIGDKFELYIKNTNSQDIEKLKTQIRETQTKMVTFVSQEDYQKTCYDLRTITPQVEINQDGIDQLKKDLATLQDYVKKLKFPSSEEQE